MPVSIVKETILIVVCLCTTVSTAIHEPQVYEILEEPLPELVRSPRHSDGVQINYYPPVFNFQNANQQDFLKAKYLRQQKVDVKNLRNPKLLQMNPDDVFDLQQQEPVHSKTFSDGVEYKENDWKPIQPMFNIPATKQIEKDLDFAASEVSDEKVIQPVDVKSERKDVNARVIYVQPDILKNNLGIEANVVQEILKNSAPELSNINPTSFEIDELQSLLGQNPELQLQGLQKLLGEMSIVQNPVTVTNPKSMNIQVQHNGSPALEASHAHIQTLQEQIDAVNKARADALLSAAQKEAEAHVQAQHQAIALAQKQAEDEVLAKIAAHNKGFESIHSSSLSGLDDLPTPAPLVMSTTEIPERFLVSSTVAPEAIEENSLEEEEVVHAQPAQPEQVLVAEEDESAIVTPSSLYNRIYAPSFNEVRENFTRERQYQPAFTRVETGSPNLQLLSTLPAYRQQQQGYAPGQGRTYLPVSSTTLASVIRDEVEPHHVAPDSSRQSIVQLNKVGRVDTSRQADNQLYSDHDIHQYAAKYAFGYRVIDEKTGNDFGHEEERDGANTKGYYFVLLPDGRRQKVDYFVDDHGYHARVSYDGVSKHPYGSSSLVKRNEAHK